MVTQTTQLTYPPIDSQGTYDFIEALVPVANQTGNINDDFKLALANYLGLDVNEYSIDDLWKRYLVDAVPQDSEADAESPAKKGRGHGGQHPGHNYPPGKLKNPGGASPFFTGPQGQQMLVGPVDSSLAIVDQDRVPMRGFGNSGDSYDFYGNAALNTTNKRFGKWSLDFDGTSDHITYDTLGNAQGPCTSFEGQDFTIELSVRFDALSTCTLLGAWLTGANEKCWRVIYNDSAKIFQFQWSVDGTASLGNSVDWTPSTGTWYDLAVVRSGDNLYMFIDGVPGTLNSATDFSGANSEMWWDTSRGNEGTNSTTPPICIGAALNTGITSSTGSLNGQIDAINVTKGAALYTADYSDDLRTEMPTAVTLPYSSYMKGEWYYSESGSSELVATFDITDSATLDFLNEGNTKGVNVSDSGDTVDYIDFDKPYWMWGEASTGTKNATKSGTIPTEVDRPFGSYVKPDGTGVYIPDGGTPDYIWYYDFSTPYDFSTISSGYDDRLDLNDLAGDGVSTAIRRIRFSPDGTKMYLIDFSGTDRLVQYTCSTPFSMSSRSYDGALSVTNLTGLTDLRDFNFGTNEGEDGMILYLFEGATSQVLGTVELSTAYDVTTADTTTWSRAHVIMSDSRNMCFIENNSVTHPIYNIGRTGNVEAFYYNGPRVALQTDFEGTDGDTSIVSQDRGGYTITMFGGADISSDQSNGGATSMHIQDATGGAYILSTDTLYDFLPGTLAAGRNQEICFELDLYFPTGYSVDGTGWINFFNLWDRDDALAGGRAYLGARLNLSDGNVGHFLSSNGGGSFTGGSVNYQAGAGTWTPTADTWHRCAWSVRGASEFRFHVDGVEIATATNDASISGPASYVPYPDRPLGLCTTVGSDNPPGSFGGVNIYPFYMDNLRLRVGAGVARVGDYTAGSGAYATPI